MTQNEKDLLLEDLCARLPYGVKVCNEGDVFDIDYISPIYGEVHLDIIDNYNIDVSEVKPYLFPLSSMTEEQKIDLIKYLNARVFVNSEISFSCLYANTMDKWKKVFEWCNKNHFDYRGLIPMGLAIDASVLNIY